MSGWPSGKGKSMRYRGLVLSVVFCLATVAQAGDWPRFLGPAGDGKSTETGLDLV